MIIDDLFYFKINSETEIWQARTYRQKHINDTFKTYVRSYIHKSTTKIKYKHNSKDVMCSRYW